MQRTVELSFASALACDRAEVWARVATMEGVNPEVSPFLKMTYPNNAPTLSSQHVPCNDVLFASWLLLFGVIPFDRHALAIESINDGVGFVEDSTSLLQRRWRHARTISELAGGCVVQDHLTVEPRLAHAAPIVERVVRRLFNHRHRKLQQQFGALTVPATAIPPTNAHR